MAVAAPRALAEHGTPRTLDDLQGRPWIVFDRDLAMHAPWWRSTFGRAVALPARVVCEIANLDEMRALAEAGVGFAVLPDYHVAESIRAGRLRIVAPPRRTAGGASPRKPHEAVNGIHLVWRRSTVETARLRAVRESLMH